MRHGCLYWVLIGWWWGVIRFVLLACIGVICTFLALPVWLLAKAVKRLKTASEGFGRYNLIDLHRDGSGRDKPAL